MGCVAVAAAAGGGPEGQEGAHGPTDAERSEAPHGEGGAGTVARYFVY